MTNMYNISNFFATWSFAYIDTAYIVAILFAISVITIKNPIISVLFLIGLFITIGGYLITIGIGFIGLSYLLVYVGAVSILFLFILMLINIRVSELINETKNSIPLIFLVTLLFANISYILLPQENTSTFKMFSLEIINNIYVNSSNSWDNSLTTFPHISTIGTIMYSTYAIWLILISFILLLAMVGAIIINVKQKNSPSKNKITNFSQFEAITLQSKLDFSLLKAKLIRLIIIGTILWSIRYLIINILEFDVSLYINYLGMLILTGSIEFFTDYFVFSDCRIPMGFSNATNETSKYDNIHMADRSGDNVPTRSNEQVDNSARNRELSQAFSEWREAWAEKQAIVNQAEIMKKTVENLDKHHPELKDPKDHNKVIGIIKELKDDSEQYLKLAVENPGHDTASPESIRYGELSQEKKQLERYTDDRSVTRCEEIDKDLKQLEETLDNKSGGYSKASKKMFNQMTRKLDKLDSYCKSESDEDE